MDERQADQLRAWLEAERNEGQEADLRFRTVFAEAVPPLEAPDSLVSGVMDALPVQDAASVTGFRFAWLVGAGLLALGGLSAALWSPVGTLQMMAASLAALGALSRWMVALASAWVDAGSAAWQVAASLGRASLVLFSSGRMPLVLLAHILVAAVACAALTRLLSDAQEEWS